MVFHFKKSTKLLAVIISLAFVFVCCFYFLAVPRILNIEKYKGLLEKITSDSLKLPVTYGNLSTSMTWNLRIRLHFQSINIKHPNNAPFVATGASYIEISLPHILQNELRIRDIEIQNPNITAVILLNGKSDLEQLIPKPKARKYKIIFEDTDISLINYKMFIIDKYVQPHQIYSIYTDVFKITDLTPNKSAQINIHGNIISKILNKKTFSPLPESTDISFSAERIGGKFVINNAFIKNNDINAKLYGNINGFTSKNPRYNLNVFIKDSKIEAISNAFPKDIKFPLNLFQKLKKYNVKGLVSTDLKIKGDYKTPKLFGIVKFDKASLAKNGNTVPYAYGYFDFDDKILGINAHASTNPNRYIHITGYTAPLLNKINLTVKSDEIQFGPAQELLFAIRDIGHFKVSILENTYFTGNGKVDLKITGQVKKPNFDGYVSFLNAKILYTGLSQPLEKTRGQIKFIGQNIYLNNIKGIISKSHVKIIGNIIKNQINVTVTSNKLNLASTRMLLLNSHDLAIIKPVIKQLGTFSGYANTKLRLNGNALRGVQLKDANLKILGGSITHKGMPFKIKKGILFITPFKTTLKSISGRLSNSSFTVNGWVKNAPNLPMNILLKTTANSGDIEKYINPHLPQHVKAKGEFPVIALVSGTTKDWQLTGQMVLDKGEYFDVGGKDIGMSLDTIRIVSLKAYGSKGKAILNTLEMATSQNPIALSDFVELQSSGFTQIFTITGAANKINNYTFDVPSPLSVKVLNMMMPGESSKPFFTEGMFTANIKFQDSISSSETTGNLTFKDVIIPSLHTTINSATINLKPENIVVEDSDIVVVDSKMKVTATTEKVFKLPFIVNKVNILATTFDLGKILEAFNPTGANGEHFFQHPNADVDHTNVVHNHIKKKEKEKEYHKIPAIREKHGKYHHPILTNQTETNQKQHEDSTASKQNRPLQQASSALQNQICNQSDTKESSKNTNAIETQTVPADPKENPGTYPIVVKDGQFKAQSFILDKLNATNASSAFNLTAEGILNLPNYALSAESGKASGNLTYNFNNNELKGNLVTKAMDSNSLATTFINLPNEVYGKLDSKNEFTVRGGTPKKMMDNTNAKSEFQIKDGHLVRLGSLEYLLLATNTLEAGIGNINLNKILNLISPYKTGYFETLGGTITVDHGILKTDNVKSKGKNLNLHLKGSLRISDNYADMEILGRVNKRVTGKLGPLGDLSINSLISLTPGIGFLPGTPGNEGIFDVLPVMEIIDKIPIIGIGGKLASKRYRFFVVRIVGNLYDPASVQSFRWIGGKELKKFKKKASNPDKK